MFSKKPDTSNTTEPATSAKPTTAKREPRTVSFTVPAMPRPPKMDVSHGTRAHAGLMASAFVLVALIAGFGGALLESRNSQNSLIASVTDQKKVVSNESQLISQIAKTVGPSVVSVNVSISDTSVDPSNPFSQFGGGAAREAQAAGTGIIISSSGLIVTNRHVVPVGTNKVSVTLSDGTELKNVEVVGRTGDADTLDIAFLKVKDTQGKKLKPAVIGDSAKVQVGDDVVAIGNALGQFQNTVTSGIISGFGRSVEAGTSADSSSSESLENLFQTDAAINEGNSGGPLVNLNGQVVGINTAIAGNGAQNIGFAIPVNDIRGLINQVLKTGKFERPYIGVRYVPLTADIASQYNLSTNNGAYIAPSVEGGSPSILPDTPAAAAGLQEGDIITHVDDKKLDQTHSLSSLLAPHQPGDKVVLTVKRDNQELKLDITLGALPAAQ